MKKVIVGVLIGLALAAAPIRADWGMGDWGTLKEIRTALVDLAKAQSRAADAATRQADAATRQAAAFERLAAATIRVRAGAVGPAEEK